MPKKLTKKEKKMTAQYLSGLKRSLSRIDGKDFDHYKVNLRNKQLVKLLLCLAYDRKLFLPQYIESLLISQLSKNPTYNKYFDENLECEIKTKSALRFFKVPRMATLAVRRNPALKDD